MYKCVNCGIYSHQMSTPDYPACHQNFKYHTWLKEGDYRDLDSFTDVRTGSNGDMVGVHQTAKEEIKMNRCYMCGVLVEGDNWRAHECPAQAARVKARHEFTEKHEAHLEYIKHEASQRLDNKYRAGVEEHGGNLQDLSMRSLLENALDEAIDQVVYLLSALEKLG